MAFAVQVVWNNGKKEYLKTGISKTVPAYFGSRVSAQAQVEFMKISMDSDCKDIHVVMYPTKVTLKRQLALEK